MLKGSTPKRVTTAEEKRLEAAGRLCANGEVWARRVGAHQSPYEFIELWWGLPAETRCTPCPPSNGDFCKNCKLPVKLARRRFRSRHEGTRGGRFKFLNHCDGGCHGGGVSVIINSWADRGFEADEDAVLDEDESDGDEATVEAGEATPEPAPTTRPPPPPSDVSLEACSAAYVKKGEPAPPSEPKHRPRKARAKKTVLDLNSPSADALETFAEAPSDAWSAPEEDVTPLDLPTRQPDPPPVQAWPTLDGLPPKPRPASPPPDLDLFSLPPAPPPPRLDPPPPIPDPPPPRPPPAVKRGGRTPKRSEAAPPEPPSNPTAPRPTAASRFDKRGQAPPRFIKVVDSSQVGKGATVGDWVCTCGKTLSQKKGKCISCGTSRHNAAALIGRPGDWICGSCSGLCFARRTNCQGCGGHVSAAWSTVPLRGGDWKCTSCMNTNFVGRRECRLCGTPRGACPAHLESDSEDDEVPAPRAAPRATPHRAPAPPPTPPLPTYAPAPAAQSLESFLEAFGMEMYLGSLQREEVVTLADLTYLEAEDLVELGLPAETSASLVAVARSLF